MYNTDPEWQQNMQILQAAYTGEDLRKQLVKCLKICKASHDYNVLQCYIMWHAIVDEGEIIPVPNVNPPEGGLVQNG